LSDKVLLSFVPTSLYATIFNQLLDSVRHIMIGGQMATLSTASAVEEVILVDQISIQPFLSFFLFRQHRSSGRVMLGQELALFEVINPFGKACYYSSHFHACFRFGIAICLHLFQSWLFLILLIHSLANFNQFLDLAILHFAFDLIVSWT
jgi:hypothetical protein